MNLSRMCVEEKLSRVIKRSRCNCKQIRNQFKSRGESLLYQMYIKSVTQSRRVHCIRKEFAHIIFPVYLQSLASFSVK